MAGIQCTQQQRDLCDLEMIDKNRKKPRRKSRKIRDALVSLENTKETHGGVSCSCSATYVYL